MCLSASGLMRKIGLWNNDQLIGDFPFGISCNDCRETIQRYRIVALNRNSLSASMTTAFRRLKRVYMPVDIQHVMAEEETNTG